MSIEFITNLISLIAHWDELAVEVTRWQATTKQPVLATYYANILDTMKLARVDFVEMLASATDAQVTSTL